MEIWADFQAILGFLVTNLKGPGHNVEVRQFRLQIPMRFR